MIRIYDKSSSSFNSNGLGILRDAISCKITEELNGQYDLQLEYPTQGYLAEVLIPGNIIKAPAGHVYGSDQLFRIKTVKRTLSRATALASHIFYDLADNFFEDVAPTDKSGADALGWLFDRTQYTHSFTTFSDITAINSVRYVRKNVVESLLGADNSFVKVWGGELIRDNFQVKFLQARGQDRGVKIRYGKNLKEIQWNIDYTNIATRVYPQGFDNLTIPEKYIDSTLISNYPHPIVKEYAFSNIKIDEENGITEPLAEQKLRDAVDTLYENGIDKPTVNIKVDFVELSKVAEYYEKYSAFESIYLGDTVEAIIPHLGLTLTLKIIKATYDALKGRYENFEIGDAKYDYVTSTLNKVSEIVQDNSNNNANVLQSAKDFATNEITSAMGGYVYKTANELFIMDTDNPVTAQKVWRWNLNGLGYSSTGISGPYNLAMTQNGEIVADFIKVGQLDGVLIKADSIDASQISLEAKKQIISDTGSNNLVRNSVGWNGTTGWTISGTTPTIIVDTDTYANTVSKSSFKFGDTTMTQDISILPNAYYTMSCKIKKYINNAYMKLKQGGQDTIIFNSSSSVNTWTEYKATFLSNSPTITVEIDSDVDWLQISDIMFVAGGFNKVWQSAAGEVYTQNVKIDDSGITVGTSISNIKAGITNQSFDIYRGTQKAISVNQDKTELQKTVINDDLTVGKIKHVVRTNGMDIVYID